MSNADSFLLAKVIKASGDDPSDVTDAVWAAGYRKQELSTEEAVNHALEIIGGFEGADLPYNTWPKSYSDILKSELNDFIIEAISLDGASAASVSKEIIAAGYSKSCTKEERLKGVTPETNEERL